MGPENTSTTGREPPRQQRRTRKTGGVYSLEIVHIGNRDDDSTWSPMTAPIEPPERNPR